MRVFVIGFGQAGCKIADLFLEYDNRTGQNSIERALAINTAKSDLMGLKNIAKEDRLLIGQPITKGHGVGANNELGKSIAIDDIYTMQSAIDRRGTHKTDAFLVIAGLGGGTGSGGAPILTRRLRELYTEPVYGLGILPSNDEGALCALNAARSFITFIREVDNLFLFDNDAWKREGVSLRESYKYMNDEITRRFGILLGAGESMLSTEDVGNVVVDASEIINTLGGGGISTIGYAAEKIVKKGVFGRFRQKKDSIDELDTTTRITSLVRRAIMGRLTIPCDVTTAERALILIAGPPDELNRIGIDKARLWAEGLIEGTEVRCGDYPTRNSKYVASVALLSGVSEIPRIKDLQKAAVDAQDRIKEFESRKNEKFTELLEMDESLRPLF